MILKQNDIVVYAHKSRYHVSGGQMDEMLGNQVIVVDGNLYGSPTDRVLIRPHPSIGGGQYIVQAKDLEWPDVQIPLEVTC